MRSKNQEVFFYCRKEIIFLYTAAAVRGSVISQVDK